MKSAHMNALLKTGLLLYGMGIIAYGIQQLVILDFRPQILPLFPAWAHQYSVFAIVTGLAMILLGAVVTGLFKMKTLEPGRICLFLGLYFFVLILACHIPYLLFIYPHKLSHLGSWGDLLKGLAFSGGAFVMASSYRNEPSFGEKERSFSSLLEKLAPVGRLFFCTTMFLFGCCHFAYSQFISPMVPKWLGMPEFWTYFGGVALIGAGVAIAMKLFLKPVSLLLAAMLFLWFLLVHVPSALANPTAGSGNAIVSAFDALLFCGVALVLSQMKKQAANKVTKAAWPRDAVEKIVPGSKRIVGESNKP
jgi:uncharacterized membrane protein YphA (DoxX/SURF4 family)